MTSMVYNVRGGDWRLAAVAYNILPEGRSCTSTCRAFKIYVVVPFVHEGLWFKEDPSGVCLTYYVRSTLGFALILLM